MAAQTWATVGALIGDRDSPVFPVRKVHFQPIVPGVVVSVDRTVGDLA